MIKLIPGGAGVRTKGTQQIDGPEEEIKELAIGNSSILNAMPPLKNLALHVPTSTEVIIERYQNGQNGLVEDSSKIVLQLGPKI